jgi:O-antigen ligase
MRERLAHLVETASVWMLAGLLVTLPFWRHRVLLHRASDPVFFEFHDLTLYTNDLLWWVAIGGWLLSRLLDPAAPRLRLGPWFLSGPLAGLLVLSLIGIPFAVDPVYAGYQTVRLLLLAWLYLMIINVTLMPGMVAWPLAAGMVLQTTVALPQFALGRSLGLRRLGEVTVQAAWKGASVVMVGEQRWLRAYGLAQHPNLLGGCLIVMLLLVIGYYLTQSGWRRLPLLIALASGLITLLVTFSRAAWLGAAVGGVMMLGLLLWSRRQLRWSPDYSSVALLAGLFLAMGAAFAVINWQLLQPRLGLTSQGVEIRSVEARAIQVKAAWALVRMRPVLGVGIGNYPTALYHLAREAVAAYPVYQPVHNVFLLSTAELGLLGGALWLAVIVAPWAALWLRRRQVQMMPWWAGLSGALAALTVVSLFDYYTWLSHQGRLALWLVWGLWARDWIRNG